MLNCLLEVLRASLKKGIEFATVTVYTTTGSTLYLLPLSGFKINGVAYIVLLGSRAAEKLSLSIGLKLLFVTFIDGTIDFSSRTEMLLFLLFDLCLSSETLARATD